MRIVLDACVPIPLRHEIPGHDVFTARFLGLSELEDSGLLEAIEGKFDVLVTCDRSIPWQNQFRGRNVAVIILRARTNKLVDLVTVVPALLKALSSVERGEILEVGPSGAS